MKTYYILILLLLGSTVTAQIDEEKKLRFSIDSIHTTEKETFNAPRINLSFQNGLQEEWSYVEGKNSKEYIINYYKDSTVFRELYFEHEGQLLFSRLSQTYAPNNSQDQIHWSCNFYIQNDTLSTLISLGHGPTEDPNWDPNSILKSYRKRMTEFKSMNR